jgi:hypothetical protein
MLGVDYFRRGKARPGQGRHRTKLGPFLRERLWGTVQMDCGSSGYLAAEALAETAAP